MLKRIQETDVVVVGGGPTGLAAAIAARLAGLEATVVERSLPPIDKPCGEGIMPDGVAILERLGVDLSSMGAVPFAGIEFIQDQIRARGEFPGRPGLGVRRTTLHTALLRRAEELQVELLWGREVLGLHDLGVEFSGGPIRSRFVVGADGIDSQLRRALGLDVAPIYRRFGIRRHFEVRPWNDHVEVHFAAGCEAYVTPVGSDLVCIAILMHDSKLRYDCALELFPELAHRVEHAPARSDPEGSGTVYRRTPSVIRGRVALIGDAAGSVDAITGAGVTLGLHQAVSLASSLQTGDLSSYDADFRRLMKLPGGMTSFMLAANRRPWLRWMMLRTLSTAPWVLSQLLSLQTRAHLFSFHEQDMLPDPDIGRWVPPGDSHAGSAGSPTA